MHEQTFPRLTVDPLIFCVRDNTLCVALYRRDTEPFLGLNAIPGGNSYANQTTRDSLRSALEFKTSIKYSDLSYVEQFHFFDDNVDPRGHAVSLGYLCLMSEPSSAQHADYFYDITNLPELAYDHASIIQKAVAELQKLLVTTTVALHLLPESFSLNDIHRLYEAAFDKKFDNRNFRKKFLSFNVLEETGKREVGVPFRPAKLYRFSSKKVTQLSELSL